MGPAELLAALSYATDITPCGSHYHSWRVALVGQLVASVLAPDIQRDVFYAGLLHDFGAVGLSRHIADYQSLGDHFRDQSLRVHPSRGASLMNWLPGMDVAASFVRSHHEWWNGGGYPDGVGGSALPVGAMIVGIASAADVAGCYDSSGSIRAALPSLAPLAGSAWTQDVWAAFVRSTRDAAFYRSLTDHQAILTLMAEKIRELPVPEPLVGDDGAERVLHLFSALIDLKDPSTKGHSLRVARRAQVLAKAMGLSETDVRTAYHAGLVHDIGRLGIETSVLNKSGRLTNKELDIARGHASLTMRALASLPGCHEMAALGQIAGHDHERFDGTGYPDQLQGQQIPMVSRILSVVDAYDAMTTATEYRMLTPKGAVVRVEQAAGTQFDPDVAAAMVAAVNQGLFDDIVQEAA